ncbi:L-2-hydroxyglutarate dehydrogenase, mitochondrial [Acrasis kona]|uniref:L-2-hydroxyglutarate dehydrogenase, mitochondrial n=1 Tax=Acrasis kona TaxID=1008807 RepID=A0AAW2ZN67_9EUKA
MGHAKKGAHIIKHRLFSPIFHSKHFLDKKFSLRMVKRVELDYPPYEERHLTHGVKSFYDRCWMPKYRSQNPSIVTKLKLIEKGPPALRVEFEDGRKYHIDDASYMPHHVLCELVLLKRQKMMRYYDILDMEYYDTDEEEDPYPDPKGEGDTKKKKKSAGGKK